MLFSRENLANSMQLEDSREKEMATHSVFLPGESQGWGRTESDAIEVT